MRVGLQHERAVVLLEARRANGEASARRGVLLLHDGVRRLEFLEPIKTFDQLALVMIFTEMHNFNWHIIPLLKRINSPLRNFGDLRKEPHYESAGRLDARKPNRTKVNLLCLTSRSPGPARGP